MNYFPKMLIESAWQVFLRNKKNYVNFFMAINKYNKLKELLLFNKGIIKA